jgi:medium-chain acyl-[acyl-carrier-protein] hydrolase
MPSRMHNGPAYLRWTNGVIFEPSAKTRLRLLCFPYAGAGASVFWGWAAALPAGIELCPIQLPGREGRWMEPPFTHFPSLIKTLADELKPLLSVPFAFFGHSMGAFISFELARQLRRSSGLSPVHLFLSAARAPHLPDPHPPIHHLGEAEFVSTLLRLHGIPAQILQNAELLRLVLHSLRADLTLFETYAHYPEPPLDCPISSYGGQQDSKVAYADLAGWSVYTRGAFTCRLFPGNHFFLTSARTSLLRTLSDELSARVKAT